MLLNVTVVISVQFKLQLKFRHNKNYSLHNCKFPYSLKLKIHQLTIKIREERKLLSEEDRQPVHCHFSLA